MLVQVLDMSEKDIYIQNFRAGIKSDILRYIYMLIYVSSIRPQNTVWRTNAVESSWIEAYYSSHPKAYET